MRTRKLVRPDVQIWLSLQFAGVAALAIIFEFILILSKMSNIVTAPGDQLAKYEVFADTALRTLLISMAVIFPLTVAVGILLTFRIAGPLYRFRVFLDAVVRGEQVDECRLRSGDKLQDICALINSATKPVRDMNEKERAERDEESGVSRKAA